jgi:lipopolysaccharide transport system ATP-binding protein
MTDIAIELSNISKKYVIGGRQDPYRKLTDSIVNALTAPLKRLAGHSPVSTETIWAVRDLSLQIHRGEVIGVIGKNGAGKSTLLKILARITDPTTGLAIVNGRVGSLLEVGTGFHPELTGRENIFLNGSILGMRHKEIREHFDEIVDFAGIGTFIDTPVKRYSSGMHMRLAFAVAAHLKTEILLVDEVLAVGDFEFQKKCLGKMHHVATDGRTVMFVSHNLEAVRSMCSRTIILQEGKIIYNGDAEDGVRKYLNTGNNQFPSKKKYQRPAGNLALLHQVRILDEHRQEKSVFNMEEKIIFEYTVEFKQVISNFHMYTRLLNNEGIIVLGSADFDLPQPIDSRECRGTVKYLCEIPGNLLNAGSYFLTVQGLIPDKSYEFNEDSLLGFIISETGGVGGATSANRPGIVRPLLKWSLE